MYSANKYPLIRLLLAGIILFSCKGKGQPPDTVAADPAELQQKISSFLRFQLDQAVADSGRLPDSAGVLAFPELLRDFYKMRADTAFWSRDMKWENRADSLWQFIREAKLFGLYPEDYFYTPLTQIRDTILADSTGKSDRRDARWWGLADLYSTDAIFRLIKDVKLGRLPFDSVTLRKDTLLTDSFLISQVNLLEKQGIRALIKNLEPGIAGYRQLKEALPSFLARARFAEYTKLPFPMKDTRQFNRLLQKRLFEEGLVSQDSIALDSANLAAAVKKIQQINNITVDGKAGEGTVRMLNLDDRERFARIAISLDKYKQFPVKMPDRYILVNTSGNYMELTDSGVVKIRSRVITGKPKTRTPLLNSAIYALITYPQWVPPASIIEKEILPAVKRNPGYLAKKGFSLLDKDGNEVDPYTVDWSKYKKSIPYRVVQGSGDANALGIMKFVFENKFAVYLHDTNQRYLFANAMRSLSHGCVRVQEWDKLAWDLLKSDSVLNGGKGVARTDSVKYWLKHKQKRTISLRNRVPVFLRYFTCEGQKGNLVFYDDVYGDDRFLRERYFRNK